MHTVLAGTTDPGTRKPVWVEGQPPRGFGHACLMGRKPGAHNQDSFAVHNMNDRFSVYSVFDGHGSRGHDVSQFALEHMRTILAHALSQGLSHPDPRTVLMSAFKQTQVLIDQATRQGRLGAERSGCTASVILHDHRGGALHVAHVGDSRCVLARRTAEGVRAEELTTDHKPGDQMEKERIEALGGQMRLDGAGNPRVYAPGQRFPGLNMTRALGDLLGYYYAGLSSDPDVHTVALTGSAEAPGAAEFVLLCSDGVWEFLSSQAAVELAGGNGVTPTDAAATLTRRAWRAWHQRDPGGYVDDITAIVVPLGPPRCDAPAAPSPPAGASGHDAGHL